MLLCYIALFNLIRKSDLFLFYSDKWHPGHMSCWQPTMQVIVVWNALWYVLQWFNTLTYIDYESRKCLMHLVLLYIKKLMVCPFEFSQCAFAYNWIDLTHTMLLYCLIHFRCLKGYYTHTYIDSYCRKYLMHLVLLYINKLMVLCLLNFACAFLFPKNRPHLQCYCIA
jgi:hypothetical protein